MDKQHITDIFFDLDNTLWDFDRNSALTFARIWEQERILIDLDDFMREYGPINRAFWKLYRDGRITKDELRYHRLRSVFNTLDYPVTDALIHSISEAYIAILSSFGHLLPNARGILDYLRPRYRLHIITNGFREVQGRKMQSAGITGYFSVVVDSEMAGAKKPNRRIFDLAVVKAGTRPENSVMIGDDLEADILGAGAVGLHTLHYDPGQGHLHDFCPRIGDLDEIKRHL